MKFSLAHFSDIHLGPLPKGAVLEDFAFKKLIGAISWHASRKKHHIPEIAAALRADILAANPDHISFTGDLVNISASGEFDQGRAWLQAMGSPDYISYTPGNHDAYVKLAWAKGLGKFEDYMSSENSQDRSFPFIRLRRNIALIGINAATPQNIISAGGTIGKAQLEKLRASLKHFRERGFYRAVMIHHPPAPGLAHVRRSLSDAKALKSVLEAEGAELVMHGHNHIRSLNYLQGPQRSIPIIGVPSASMHSENPNRSAAWNLYEIDRAHGNWQTQVSIRNWNTATKSFVQGETYVIEGDR